MKAVGYRMAGPSSVLTDLELPDPQPGPRDLLVAVSAVSVNQVDVKLRAKASPKEGAKVLGFDVAGVVQTVGEDVTLFRPGDEVFYAGAIDRQGGNAALQVVDERIVGPKPKSLTMAQAAALPLTALTAWELLFEKLGVARDQPGGGLLVINGAGGVGSILIQLASRLTGLTVIATASRPQSVEWVKRMGAQHVVDHRQPLDEQVRALGLRHVRYVAGLTDTDKRLPEIAKLIAPLGVLGVVDDCPSLDITPLRGKAVTVAWEGMFVRSLFKTPDMVEQHRILREVSALVDAGILETTLARDGGALNAANLAAAHAFLESGQAIGKTALTVG